MDISLELQLVEHNKAEKLVNWLVVVVSQLEVLLALVAALDHTANPVNFLWCLMQSVATEEQPI
jgi:hypothetical protein